MALSRRKFVHTVGIGSAGADWIMDRRRGREDSIWSAFEPTLEAVAPGVDLPGEQRESDRARQDRAEAVRAAFGEGGAQRRAAIRRSRATSSRRSPRSRACKPENIVLGCGSTQILRTAHPPLHGAGQGARRHDPDLRRVRRLRRDDGQSCARGVARRRLQDRPRQDRRRGARARDWSSIAIPNNPMATYVGATVTRLFLAQGEPRFAGDDDPGRRGLLRLRHRSRSRYAHRPGRREPARRRRADVLQGLRHGRPAHGLCRRPRRYHQEDARLGRRLRRELAERPGAACRHRRDEQDARSSPPSARATPPSATSR